MSVIEHNFRLLIIDSERVVLIPAKGELRELPKQEAEHAIRFLGIQRPKILTITPRRIAELAKPLEDAPPDLSNYQLTILKILGQDGDQMTVQGIWASTGINQSTIAGCLYKLEILKLVSRVRRGVMEPHLWQITPTGIDVLAELTPTENKNGRP